MKEFVPESELKKFYVEQLEKLDVSQPRDLAEIDPASFRINPEQYVSAEREAEIERQYPDEIEVLGKERKVTYSYNPSSRTFTAAIELFPEEIIQLKEPLRLPSGEELKIKVLDVIFSPTNFETARNETIEKFIKDQWRKKVPSSELVEGLPASLPPLPEPIIYGFHPETGKALYAYPAYVLKKDWSGRYIGYQLTYFRSPEKAQEQQQETERMLKEIKEEQERKAKEEKLKQEKERLLDQIEELSRQIRSTLYDYERWLPQKEFTSLLEEAREQTRGIHQEELETAVERLRQLAIRLEEAKEKLERQVQLVQRAEEEVFRLFPRCPLCGGEWQETSKTGVWKCSERHDANRIKFPIELDEDGYAIESDALLAEAQTEKGEVVAEIDALSGYDYRGDFYWEDRGIIRLYLWPSLKGEDVWKVSPYYALLLTDYKAVVEPEQAEVLRQEQEKAKRRLEYENALAEAQKKVESGEWQRGYFRRGRHPKTGELQWEIETTDSSGRTIKYIVDRYGEQPSDENLAYFFEPIRVLVDRPNFKLIVVRLQSPFPENDPEYSGEGKRSESNIEISKLEEELATPEPLEELREEGWEEDQESQEVEEDQESEDTDEESLEEKLRKLQDKWGAH